jgi:hypothetical protein
MRAIRTVMGLLLSVALLASACSKVPSRQRDGLLTRAPQLLPTLRPLPG